jgi:predicted GIY-YIG superfamily endonuclease
MAILTVYTKLLDKTLDGARIIDMGSTKSCECFVLPRNMVAEVGKKHPQLRQHCFYILLGKDNRGGNMAYIGESQDFTDRVNDHKIKKDFWDTALVFISKANEIFDSEVLYLEYLGYQAAIEAGNYTIENTNEVKKKKLSADKENEMELFFEDIQFLTRFYGCKVFDKPEKFIEPEQSFNFTMTMSKSGMVAHLKFYKESRRYVIEAGSTIIGETYVSCPKTIASFRKQVMVNKKLSQKDGDLYILQQDVDLSELINSPSGAASFCAGTSYQGTIAWVDGENNTYPSEWWKEDK